mmetsp:Transcript_27646/g.20764  ORF Transcript_27646/g.20764 Transcript_27646/m.20764 type:complete len:132 (-) Transcript_27646:443-838(-)
MSESKSSKPFIKDFEFYKGRFQSKHKEIKVKLREFGSMVERFECTAESEGDLESFGSQLYDLIARINKFSEEVQLEIDELEEVEKEVSNFNSHPSQKQQQLRMKALLKDLQSEHSQLKKILRSQVKYKQSC